MNTKSYKTKLSRMKIETLIRRLVSGKFGNRVRQWLRGKLSATVGEDGWIHFARI